MGSRRFGLALGIICWLAVASAAAEPKVEIAAPDRATCVSEAELGAALRRAGLVVAEGGSAQGADGVTVSVEGTPEELVVVVRRTGAELSQRLAATTCDTATDVVAAFVVSALAPAPVVPVGPRASEPRAEPDVRGVARAVLDELGEREIDFAKKGTQLTFSRDASRRFVVRLDRARSPECTRSLVLGTIHELTVPLVTRITNRVAEAIEQAGRCLPGTWQERARFRHLESELDALESRESWGMVRSSISLGLGATTLVAMSLIGEPDPASAVDNRENAFAATAGAVMLVGGTAGLLLPQDYRPAARDATSAAFNGAFWAWLVEAHDDSRTPHAATALFAGGMTTAGLVTLNAVLRRPPLARLRAAGGEFTRRMPSTARVAEVERDLRGLDPPVPNWITYSPMIAAGAVAIVPAATNEFAEDTLVAAIGGFGFLLLGAGGAILPTPAQSYRSNLEESGLSELSLGPGPGDRGGLSLAGKF